MATNLLQTLGQSEFLRFGVRDRIIRLFSNPDSQKPQEFTTPFFGGMYQGNLASFIDWSVYYYGAYCKEELNLISDFTTTESVVLDIGANVGHHSLFAALNCKRVVSFEPLPFAAASLEQKIAVNKLTNLTVQRYALGLETNVGIYHKPASNNQGTGSFISSAGSKETIELPIKRGDEAINELKLDVLSFIKIDVEGFEEQVLRGLSQSLTKHRPIVFFEWSANERNITNSAESNIFPPKYRFFKFNPDTNIAIFFRKRGYTLTPTKQWPDGNILALPEELLVGKLGDLVNKKIS